MGNKKIFTISSDFELIKKPKWLDGFRIKHDKPFPYHVTLKTCTYFDIDNFKNLKKDLSGIVKKYSEIKVIFNKLFISRSSKGECIMIKADNNKKLNELQKEIVKKFSKYGNYIAKKYEKFEKSFIPHITIARHLSSEQLIIAKKDLGKKLFCEAVVKGLSLMIVENNTDEEWLNHNNKSYYKLQNK
ncbi:MAG: 2'-5' RNA ligase family protein [Patescibacteria group bacterium]|nr:2'-5' RNA ligase family protein [Patescibacteria group bacterium]